MPRRRLAFVLIALFSVAGLLGWWGLAPQAPSHGHTAPWAVPTASVSAPAPNASGGDPWALLAAAQSAQGGEPPGMPQVKPEMSEADWQAFDRQWCAAMAPVRERLQGSGSWLDSVRVAMEDPERFELPKDQQDLMHELLAQRTEQALLTKDDARSRAVALWAHSARSGSAEPAPGAALLALAQSTRDPMVVALAAQTLRDPASAQLARALWRELEPDNLAPLLLARGDEKLAPEVFLQRIAQAGRHETYLDDAMGLLLGVPPPIRGGPSEWTAQVAATGRQAAVAVPWAGSLSRPCQGSVAPDRAALCEQAAQRIWNLGPDSVLLATEALKMVRDRPAQRSTAWDERAQQVEASFQWQADEAQRTMDEIPKRIACLPAPSLQRAMVENRVQGEWATVQRHLSAQPGATAALAARFRAGRQGRSLIDPEPSKSRL